MEYHKSFWVFLVIFLTYGCSSTNIDANYANTLESWRWGKKDQLLRVWGRPEQIIRLPNDNVVYVYPKETYRGYPTSSVISDYGAVSKEMKSYPINGTNTNAMLVYQPKYPPASMASFFLQCKTQFEIDPQNVIVDIRATGNDCTADAGFVYEMSRK